ncbi:complement factor H-related protein 3-like isoform X2 [Perca flavescens]|uniref:complement factor H-related protein 3-like isoform X2 n=1 Tax=Perca flavescens TaxID=8167 RepID=UPI00106F0879|nr:complement factor H-related protein 3-like isoform X2 [Perca flavescens]
MRLFHLLWLFILLLNSESSLQNDTCPKPEVPNGFAVGPYNNTIYYSCNEGFKLFTNNGWWAEAKCNDSQLQQCIENTKCGETPVIPNGKVVLPQRPGLRQIHARITCNTGYSPNVNYLSCHEGEWTSNKISPNDICTPTAKLCKPPPKVEYAVVRTSYQMEYLSDSPVTYQCRDHYHMEGEHTILCNDGEWEEKNVTCTQITCDRKDIPEADIVLNNKQRYSYNEQVGYRCKDGYQEEFTLTCGGDGWIGRSTCKGCRSPPPLTDGDIKDTVKTDYSHQERVEFMCQNYYTMEGGPHRTCINGEWTGQIKCLKPCTVDRPLMNRYNISFKYTYDDKLYSAHNDNITFTCTEGHSPTGTLSMRQQCIEGVMNLPTCQ